MNYWSFLAMFASFLLSLIVCPKIIPILKKLKFGQNERLEGNPEHLKKQGTPTMGAFGFLPVIVLVSLVFGFVFFDVSELKKWLPVLLLTIGFGAIGFADDYLKVVKKQNEGFKPKQKLFCQFVLAAGFTAYCFFTPEIGSEVILPFSGGKTWDMKWLYLPFALIAVLGTDNGTNLTDGVDGLMSSVTVVTSLVLMVMSERLGGGVSYLSGAVAGALMGFLFINAHPAKAFMGDTGSLALGGFVAGSALVMRSGWFILLFGLIYLVETISVILQVVYFKLTHGKRLFKMTPIHHSFELSGWSETRVVTMFTVVTVLMGILSLIAL